VRARLFRHLPGTTIRTLPEGKLTDMIKMFAGVLSAALFLSTAAFAESSTIGPVEISVPEGFGNRQTQRQGSSQTTGWTKFSSDQNTKALLQVSVYDFGSELGKPSKQELVEGAEQYLREFLSGIERRRENYVLSPIERLQLAGLPAARGRWRGNIGTVAAVGVMYCVIVDNRFVVSFHTQDLGSKPTDAMQEAMKSIEAMQVVRGS
jgi:hypothetical protein